jgi:hypothetical protein
VTNTTTGNLVEIFQKYRNSKAKLVLDSSYTQEVEATAELILEKNAHVHLLMKGDFNQNTFQPSSSFNEHNQYLVQEGFEISKSDDTHTSLLQYGDPKRAKQEDDLTNWSPVKTLKRLTSNGLEDSLQARVLKEDGFMRIYDIDGIICPDHTKNILVQFFDATFDSITECKGPTTTTLAETTEAHKTTESQSSPTPSSCVDGTGLTDFLFLIDSSASMCPFTEAIAEGMSSFISGLNDDDVDSRFAVASFGGPPRVLQAFSVRLN